jgi:hypothetical protein
VFYVLTFGRRPLWVGIAYGVVMELCMLGLFPFFLTINEPFDFVALSLIGHVCYGAMLGAIASRYARRWPRPAVVMEAAQGGASERAAASVRRVGRR